MVEIAEDIGEKVIRQMEELVRKIDKIVKEKEENELNFPKFPALVGEKKNSHLHIVLETSLLESIKKEASIKGISIGDYCRRRLRGIY